MSECKDRLATRPLLYTDINGELPPSGEQWGRDDMWAVTTEELNAVASLRQQLAEAQAALKSAEERASQHAEDAVQLRVIASGRTVSCSQCNGMAAKIAAARAEAFKEAAKMAPDLASLTGIAMADWCEARAAALRSESQEET